VLICLYYIFCTYYNIINTIHTCLQVQKARDSGLISDSVTIKEIVAEAERLEVKSKATLVLAELLFDDKIHLQVQLNTIMCS